MTRVPIPARQDVDVGLNGDRPTPSCLISSIRMAASRTSSFIQPGYTEDDLFHSRVPRGPEPVQHHPRDGFHCSQRRYRRELVRSQDYALRVLNQGVVAYEYVIALANQSDKDLWINVPFYANEDFVTHMAQLFKSQLKPTLHLYVEYGNELWNNSFGFTHVNGDLAQAELRTGNTDLSWGDACSDSDITNNVGNCSWWNAGSTRYARRTAR